MKTKVLIRLNACLLLATIVVAALYASSDRLIHKGNNFLRIHLKHVAIKRNEIDLKYNSWYIAGIDEKHIYLGNIVSPLHLLITNHALTDSQHVFIKFMDPIRDRVYQTTAIKIDSPYFYMADGFAPSIYRGKIGNWVASRFMYDSAYYNQLVPISYNSFGIRTNALKTLDNLLGKEQRDTPQVQLNPTLLQKQIDGIFCTDGELVYNDDLKRLIYTYRYRNGYIVYDTNLNLDYRGHTIDTFMRAQIRVGYVQSNNTKTLIYKRNINIATSTAGIYLFVGSGLTAQNDFESYLSTMSPIDVYDLTKNEYKFTFSLVNHRNKIQLDEFTVYKNKILVALFDSYLVKYDLQTHHFNGSIVDKKSKTFY